MALFDIPTRPGVSQDMMVAKKVKSKAKKTSTTIKSGGLAGQIQNIVRVVDSALGQYRGEYKLIQDEKELHRYLDHCRDQHYISIDTETNGLNPFQNIIAGICIYTRGEYGAYIPINHINYLTEVKLPNQLPADVVIREFEELLQFHPEVDMFNAPFDIRFLRAFGIKSAYCTWDASIGAMLLNENELKGQRGLKELHNKYCLGGKGDAFAYDDLFKKVPFTYIPLDTACLYAGHDPKITTEYCDFQRQFLTYHPDEPTDSRNGMNGVAWVFHNIEMPIVDVVVDMETTGIEIDLNYNAELAEKYHKLLAESMSALHGMLQPFEKDLRAYKAAHPKVKLDIPINFASPKQLEILLYDIIGLDAGVDKRTKKPIRGTGEEILATLNHPICKAILEYRGLEKLVSTYIDKLPACIEPSDNRVHCNFHQYGAKTGRFSSSDPNLQNIPAHNKDIRKMFKARDGYVLLSSDYSQQEPSCLATFCKQAGATALFDARFKGNDLYSTVASACFKLPYEQCCEFDAHGHKNPPEFKERRGQAKPILLGILYGRSDESVAEQLHCTLEEAKQLKVNLFNKFPEIQQFEQDSLRMAQELGYVTTVCGRKRRLPELQLPEYEFKWVDGFSNPYDDPLDFEDISGNVVPDVLCDYFWDKLQSARYRDIQKIYKEAESQGIEIISNKSKISGAVRQCVNARIQGSAADLTKLAMIKLHDSEQLKALNFKMLIPVHDEIIAECPEEHVKECAKLLADTMSKAAEEILYMPFNCDVEVSKVWYGKSIEWYQEDDADEL